MQLLIYKTGQITELENKIIFPLKKSNGAPGGSAEEHVCMLIITAHKDTLWFYVIQHKKIINRQITADI